VSPPPGRSARRQAAFTLIEMLAVVAILALVATFVAPSFDAVRQRKLRSEAMRLAIQLEFARQRTVMTGVPHRVLLDLEQSLYRVEWLGGDAGLAPPQLEPTLYDTSGGTPLPLEAPPIEASEYTRIPGNFGRDQLLEDDLFIAGLETPEGWLERGESFVSFDRDGTASYTEIVLEDESGEAVALAVYPLEDAVQLLEDESG
jgi:prepilin-type N-terminal cleavage/methylation domain-containing protein